MSYNDKKIVKILLEHCDSIKSRFPDYHDEMKNVLAEVLRLERDHDIARTNITAKIGDQINTLGMLLYRSSGKRREPKS